MNCAEILPYIPGHAGGDLRADSARSVEVHLATCDRCRAESERAHRVLRGLAALTERDVDPPPVLLESILERTAHLRTSRRLLPALPIAAGDVPRLVLEHKETIASVGAAAIVAAGAAYALWRAVRGSRAAEPAI